MNSERQAASVVAGIVVASLSSHVRCANGRINVDALMINGTPYKDFGAKGIKSWSRLERTARTQLALCYAAAMRSERLQTLTGRYGAAATLATSEALLAVHDAERASCSRHHIEYELASRELYATLILLLHNVSKLIPARASPALCA
ncbi:hypothetical protein C8J57DRAFT_1722855 [Mycena rebaudengoi]|nr:hypothetical protein C8J57DRAFT_1722855 [Mycena rebaudengoi]